MPAGVGHAPRLSYSPRMATRIVLLRGINLGSSNRIAMPHLRDLFTEAGFEDVRTYLQSGNVVLSGPGSSEQVARECERLIADRFGLEIPVVVRTRAELAKIVQRDPLGRVAANPKRYQVSFMTGKLTAEVVRKLEAAAAPSERFVAVGPYRWVRNPIYIAALLVLVAEAWLFLSLPLVVYAVLAGIGCHLFVVVYEEPTLQKRFGEEYDLYRRDVWRWIPHVPQSRGL